MHITWFADADDESAPVDDRTGDGFVVGRKTGCVFGEGIGTREVDTEVGSTVTAGPPAVAIAVLSSCIVRLAFTAASKLSPVAPPSTVATLVVTCCFPRSEIHKLLTIFHQGLNFKVNITSTHGTSLKH